MSTLPCDCHQCSRCRYPASTIIIDAKGRPRLSCDWHRTMPDFDYAKDEQCFPIPFDRLPPDLARAWRKAEREWQRKLRKKIAALQSLLEASEARLGEVPESPASRPAEVNELQRVGNCRVCAAVIESSAPRPPVTCSPECRAVYEDFFTGKGARIRTGQ